MHRFLSSPTGSQCKRFIDLAIDRVLLTSSTAQSCTPSTGFSTKLSKSSCEGNQNIFWTSQMLLTTSKTLLPTCKQAADPDHKYLMAVRSAKKNMSWTNHLHHIRYKRLLTNPHEAFSMRTCRQSFLMHRHMRNRSFTMMHFYLA